MSESSGMQYRRQENGRDRNRGHITETAPDGASSSDLATWARNGDAAVELRAALIREQVLLRDRDRLLQRQMTLNQERDHRLLNSLQMIAALLSLQSRAAPPEAAAHLVAAADRVTSFGRVHHRLLLLNDHDYVEFKQFLEQLCADMSDLVCERHAGAAISVEAAAMQVPTAVAIPLGLIVNELITNSTKYAKGAITVRFQASPSGNHLLSVLDGGPGFPAGFVPSHSNGLGMKIVQSLVKQIGGELRFAAGDNGRGACVDVTFAIPASSEPHSL